METKKKYHGIRTGALLVFLLLSFLGFSSTCYALTPSNQLTVDLANSLIDKTIENSVYFYDSSKRIQVNNVMNSFKNSVLIQNFVNSWNSTVNTTYFPYLENMTFYISPYSNGYLYVYVLQNNNEIGDTLPFIKTSETDYGSWFVYYTTFCDENGNSKNVSYFTIRFVNDGSYVFSGISSSSSFNLGNYYPGIVKSSSSDTAFFPLFYNFGKPQPFFTYKTGADGYYWLINTNNIPLSSNEPAEPENPGGDSSGDVGGSGTITNSSGDITGNIDLTGIENSLNNIENKISTSGEIASVISGEVGKITDTLTSQPDISDTVITSDDIESALNFEFESDPYANFWLELTNGLKNALLGTKRTIDISFQSRTWTIDLDDFAVLPPWLKIILVPFSTVFFVWVLVRWWKVILDKITSGNVDSILKENSEERHFKFVLGGIIK